jgi:hypothetical protein
VLETLAPHVIDILRKEWYVVIQGFELRSRYNRAMKLERLTEQNPGRITGNSEVCFEIDPDKWDEQVLQIGETGTHEKPIAAPHRGSSTQTG